jgi:hypothetical protein
VLKRCEFLHRGAVRLSFVRKCAGATCVPSLRTIIDELDFPYWWPTEIGWRQASGAFKRGVSLGRRSESTNEVWFGEELRSRSRSPPVAAGALTSGAPDNKFEGGYGISGAKRKELLWERANA